MRNFILILAVTLLCCVFVACHKKNRAAYSYNKNGYYFRLIEFDTKSGAQQQGNIAKLSVEFATQHDSVFWDSFNNLGDQFFVAVDSTKPNALSQHLGRCSVGDSVELLVNTAVFFRQQFQAEVPAVFDRDSIVKLRFRVLEFIDAAAVYLISADPGSEQKRIVAYFGSAQKAEEAKDPQGFYWIGKRYNETARKEAGSIYKIRYKGSFLNGRPVDRGFQEMDYQVETPDQVLTGLNYVIQRLNLGDNAKIILPSRLAFGDEGSGDGQVPAGTPLIYEVTLISK